MLTFVFAFLLLASIITLMAVGSIFQNKPIKGSCGGMAALGMVADCEICGGDQKVCEDVNQKNKIEQGSVQHSESAKFYDATKK